MNSFLRSFKYFFSHPVLCILAFSRIRKASYWLDQMELKDCLSQVQKLRSHQQRSFATEMALSYCHMVDIKFFKKSSCLRSTLAAYSLSSHTSKFILGVSKEDGFKAHAWLEESGVVYSAIPTHSYSKTLVFPLGETPSE